MFRSIQIEYGSFDRYIWGFSDNMTIYEDVSVTTDELSDRISQDLTRRGMKYAGNISIYSYLQSIGIINSHTERCFCYKEMLSGSKDISKV
nr:DNA-3-methyladenine glycosylase I [Clostridium sp. 19966]